MNFARILTYVPLIAVVEQNVICDFRVIISTGPWNAFMSFDSIILVDDSALLCLRLCIVPVTA